VSDSGFTLLDGTVIEKGISVIKTLTCNLPVFCWVTNKSKKDIMANVKMTHRSSGIVVDGNGKAVRFSKEKALAYITPEKGKVRQVNVNGVFCDLFYMETSVSKKNGSTGLLGVSIKGLLMETTAVRTVAVVEKTATEKAAEPEINLADLFGAEDVETEEAPAN
jgi:hypothetical protein